MGIPSKLKDMMLFNNGNNYLGQIASVTPPVLTRKMEEWRGGGMRAPVKVDLGMEALTMEWTCGGFMREVMAQWGEPTLDGIQLRFVGAYQRDDTGAYDTVEIVARGRHEEIDMGEAKVGEDTEFSVTTALAYYKLSVNGSVVQEFDLLNMVEIVNGVDRLSSARNLFGI
ncbi:phage major tail tube protein [Sphingomonas cavernae]|uniref:Phage major tail tube protein n=1 Tax=Sphingomonas cavernae TaxID=2320861 RepID=A0A418WP41_9SPHN|nr:phage major tail tube protein [Sphingomonas cavernae]RJF92993.1 phage major tail tube protein [Sphingomonas cavernae]